jgi:hypothetical protein
MVGRRLKPLEDAMVTVLFGLAVAVLSAPIGMAMVVSVASRREDSAGKLAGHPRGPIEAVARCIVGFHCKGIDMARPEAKVRPSRRCPRRFTPPVFGKLFNFLRRYSVR